LNNVVSIDVAVAKFVALDLPILCLDTCDFLDVVRGVAEGNLSHAESFRRMRDTLGTDPNSFQVVTTYLVRHEWEQNKDKIVGSVKTFLRSLADSIKRLSQVRELSGLSVPSWSEEMFDPLLLQA